MKRTACRARRRLWTLCALLSGLSVGVPHGARAQGIGGTPTGLGMAGSSPSFTNEQLNNSLKQSRPPPAALPGAQPRESAVAPPERVPSLLSPTEALFDAVNRGDIAAARDALSRGADFNGRDELGMTPLDLSIDLGRNDISFLLLSLRAADSGVTGSPKGLVAQEPDRRGTGKPGRPDQTARGERRPFSVRQVSVQPRDLHAGEQTLPKLFAGDGGAPIPQAGFLGFGGR